MDEPTTPADAGEFDPVRIPVLQREGIEASVRRLMEQSAQQAQQLDQLASAPDPRISPFAAFGLPGVGGPPPAPAPDPRPIMELDGEEREDELDALSDWVDDFLLPVYGTEVTTATPWCLRWQDHDDVVAWLHALWLSYQQHKDPEAGLAGMFIWHRDFLTHAMAAIRSAGGPLSACMTSPDRPAHRVLHGPPASVRTEKAATTNAEPDEPGTQVEPTS